MGVPSIDSFARLALKLKLGFAIAVVTSLSSAASSQVPSFTPLGGPPNGAIRSTAVGVSGDGSVVTGSAHFALGQSGAIRWTRDGGIVFIPDVVGSPGLVETNAASADGSLIAGVRPVVGSPVDTEAFRWTAAGGTVPMGFLSGPTGLGARSGAYDVSADGTTIVGFSSSSGGVQAFRWTAATGMVGLTRAGGFETSDARGVSVNGNVVVGSNYANFGASQQAFRWEPFIGMRPLRPLAGDLNSEAYRVSDDGRVTVGMSGMNFRDRTAVRWIGEGLAEPLIPLVPPGGTVSARIATAVSADGSVIVGTSDDEGPFLQSTFIWDATHGVRNLKNVLLSYGLDVSQWSLTQVSDISADGHTIVGFGYHVNAGAQGWVAVIPEPGTSTVLLLVTSTMLMKRRRR